MNYDEWLMAPKNEDDEWEAASHAFWEEESVRICETLTREVEYELPSWLGGVSTEIEDKIIELAELIAQIRAENDSLVYEARDDEPYSPYEDR